MQKKRFSEEQIVGVLQRLERGEKGKDLSREVGVSATTLYNWKAKYDGMTKSDIQELKALKNENRRLKRLVADLSLDNQILKDVNSKNW